jgi:23S rRNA (pseudouridine1915-N3)-methyltransferase
MFKVKIIAVGRSKEIWLDMALAEYEKRLQGRLQIEWLIAKESVSLFTYCRKEPLLIALDIKGELFTSEAFSEKWMHLGARAAFVIGGPDGLSQEILKLAHFRWSLSPLTFTNQMARLLLIEQVYRALEIAQGTPYHK